MNQSYLPLADLRLEFDSPAGAAGYRRDLDLDTAIATVSLSSHQRETFASHPDQVIVSHLAAAPGNTLTFTITLESPIPSQTIAEGLETLVLRGKAPSHVDPNYYKTANPILYDDAEGKGMRFEARLKLQIEGGSVAVDHQTSVRFDYLRDCIDCRYVRDRLRVQGATAVTILISAATGFRGFNRLPDLPAGAISAAARKHLDGAARFPYSELKVRHIADHQKLFRRVSMELGEPVSVSLPTDQRLKAFKTRPDPQLLALYFQFGRYLLISSSRPGTQPANSQGVWNDQMRPPWSANWTTNVNVQMNYWPAETCNLSECHEPFFDLIEGLAENGRKTAEVNYGMKGWVAHHNVDLGAKLVRWATTERAIQRGPIGIWPRHGSALIFGSITCSLATPHSSISGPIR